MRKRINASVRMRIVVEVTPHDTWGDECGIEQIEKQGREAAINTLLGVLALAQKHGSTCAIRIVEPASELQVVLHVEKR